MDWEELIRRVEILSGAGERQQAYRLLLECQDQVAAIEDEDIRQIWEFHFAQLHVELGGSLGGLQEDLAEDLPRRLAQPFLTGLARDEMPQGHDLQAQIDWLQEGLSELTGAEDAPLRHRFLAQLACLQMAAGEHERTLELLDEAKLLEDRLTGDLPALERETVLARRACQFGDPDIAVEIFTSLLPRAERALETAALLEFLGFYLEAMGKSCSGPDCEEIRQISDYVLDLFDKLLARQPGAPSRRRIREMQQRPIESAVATLLSAAERSGLASAAGQAMLSQAWTVVMLTRNPELQMIPRGKGRPQTAELRALEDAFHAALWGHVTGTSEPATWQEALKDLSRGEIAALQAPGARAVRDVEVPRQGAALAFFQFRTLLTTRPLIVLICRDGQLGMHWISQAERELIEPLRRWSGRRSDTGRRGLVRHLFVTAEEADQPEVEVSESPEDLLARRPLFPTSLLAPEPALHPSRGWYVFPEGPLHGVPIESLPDWTTADRVLGERLPIRLCLRPAVSPSWEKKLDLSRGWLGLGGAPYNHFQPLPGTGDEILCLQEDLRCHGFPAEALLGEDAHAGNLAARLATCRPAVLHLAVHGAANSAFPDACALILAPAPGTWTNELLPFRQISRLPLEGVQLVVLSACSSLVGPVTKSAGMEGLAWAFLQAGAAQVLASRDEVEDTATCRLMQVFYRYLRDHPVAEALRRTRAECLQDPEIGLYEVGLWSLWS